MPWNLGKIREEIGETSEIISVHGCSKTGAPQNVPAHYIELGIEQQLDEANRESKHYIRIHYRGSAGTALSHKVMPLRDIYVPHPSVDIVQPTQKYYILLTNMGIKQVYFPEGISIPALDKQMEAIAWDEADRSIKSINENKAEGEKAFIPDNDYWKSFMPIINQVVPITKKAFEAGRDYESVFTQ